jgi:hypothetical protein
LSAPTPETGCIIEGTLLPGLISFIDSGVAMILAPASVTSSVWGDNVYGYSTYSDFSLAAVHAGILAPGETGWIRFINLGMKPGPFPSTTANGITTILTNEPWCAVTIERVN